MTINERFIELINKLYSGNNAAFSKAVGVAPSVIQNVVGKRKGKPSYDVIEKICAFANINAEWLISGNGDMIVSNNANVKPSPISSETAGSSIKKFPHSINEMQGNARLLGFATPAITEETVPVRYFEPSPSATFKEFCEGVNETPEIMNILPEPGDNINEHSCIFTVSGDSMAPQIQDKAKVLCEEIIPSRWFSLYHGVVVIVYDDRFVIKRIKKNCLDTKNYILLCSDNPEYPGTERAYLGAIRSVFKVNRVVSQKVY